MVDIWESRSASAPEVQPLTTPESPSGRHAEKQAQTVELPATELAVPNSGALNEPQETPVDPVPQIEEERSEVPSNYEDRPVATAAPTDSVKTLNSEELIERIAHRVVEKMSREVVEKIAWKVVPDLAELLIKEQIEAHLKSRPL